MKRTARFFVSGFDFLKCSIVKNSAFIHYAIGKTALLIMTYIFQLHFQSIHKTHPLNEAYDTIYDTGAQRLAEASQKTNTNKGKRNYKQKSDMLRRVGNG